MASGGSKEKREYLDKAFYIETLLDDGGTQRNGRVSLNDYTIDLAQFCHRPLANLLLNAAVSVAKVPEFMFVRMPHKVIDKAYEVVGEEPEELIPGLPSGHHRYIRFRTNQYYPGTGNRDKVWGTMERLEEGVVCALYKSERASVRKDAQVTQVGILPFSNNLEMLTKTDISVAEVFHGVGGRWNGEYDLTTNNCVHYALEIWKELGGKAAWNDVVDGHNAYFPGNHNPRGKKWLFS